MTDLNKVRDEACEAFADQRKDRKLGTHDNHEWVELVMAGRNAFDAAIAHLSKQSVKLDEQDLWRSLGYDDEKEPAVTPILHGGRLAHNNCALIYEAKLAVAVEALKMAKNINEISAKDFETLRVMKFDQFNVHNLDGVAIEARIALEELAATNDTKAVVVTAESFKQAWQKSTIPLGTLAFQTIAKQLGLI